MLPRVKINYLNGQLGTVPESEDGLFGLVFVGFDVPEAVNTLEAHSIRSVADLEALGFTAEGYAEIHQQVEEFYGEAEVGTKLVVIFYNEDNVEDLLTDSADALIEIVSAEELRGLFVYDTASSGGTQTIVAAAQEIAVNSTNEHFAPIFICLASAGTSDYSKADSNRVCLLCGGAAENGTSGIGLMAGRLASIPVHRNIGRVKDGALNAETMYVAGNPVYPGMPDVADIHDKCYITPRAYVGLSGYYFADDCMACDPTDDYAHLTARRTVDKAYRIAYQTLVQFMLDEIEVNEDGTMQNGVLKSWQQAVENAINRQMTAKGELSATDGEGCVCFIDPTQNVLATSRIELTLKVRPYGYARFIDVNLGFQVTA